MKTEEKNSNPQQETTTPNLSPVMEKALANMERLELSFTIDEAKFEAKHISGHVTIHLRQSGSA